MFSEGTIEIVDATAKPKRIDYFGTDGAAKGMHVRAIYTLDGEEHAICSVAGPAGPPGEFSGKAGFYRVTRRAEDAAPAARKPVRLGRVLHRPGPAREQGSRSTGSALECRLADGEAGTLTLDPTAPAVRRNSATRSRPASRPRP